MKKITVSFLFLISSIISIAQTSNDDYYGAPVKPKLLAKDRISASVIVGTGVNFSGNSRSTSFTTFIAPKINYQLSKKFKINVGLMHYTATPNTGFFMNPNEAIINRSNKSISGNLIFVGGEYQLNKKVILSGAVMMDASGLNNKQNNYKAASFGVDYKVSEHSSIKFETTISNGQGNYYNNPFPATGSNSFGGFSNGMNNSIFR